MMRPLDKLADRFYRLNNLYFITDKNGKKVKFKMTAEQLDYFDKEHNRNVILKARQLGFTTEKCIMQVDSAIFESKRCAMIAHTLPDARRLFREKVKYAYDHLPDIIKQANPVIIETKEELVFKKGGSVSVSTSFRGGTLQSLHVSEFGKICVKYPEKAREIITGAFEALGVDGIGTLESTAEGRQGRFFDISQEAEKLALSGKELTKQDFKFFFYSWHQMPEYQMPVQPLPERLINYFYKLEHTHGIKLTDEQKSWYYGKEKTLGADMKREYPSIPSEAFEQSVEGAYYAKQFAELYAKGLIADELPDNKHAAVDTYWDLGVSDSTTIWFIKKVGERYQVIDCYSNSGEGLNHYLGVLQKRGYNYGRHVAPHDVENRTLGSHDAKSLRQQARDGYTVDGVHISINFEVVKRTTSVNTDIEMVRQILPLCEFDAVKCDDGIKALENYKKDWNEKAGMWRDKPLHDWSSHYSDAFRYFAVYQTKPKPVTHTSITMSF